MTFFSYFFKVTPPFCSIASKTKPQKCLRQLFNIYSLHKTIKVFNYRHNVIYRRKARITRLTFIVIRFVLEQSLPCYCLYNPFGASQPIGEDIAFDPLGWFLRTALN